MDSDSDKLDLNSSLELLYELIIILNTMGFKTLSRMKDLIFDPSIPKSQQKMKSSELLVPTSKTKAQLTEILDFFNLLEKYIQVPSEETANQLQFLFDRGKQFHQIFTPDKVDKLLGKLRTFLITCSQHGELELQEAGAQATMESQRNKKLQDENTSLKTEIQEILEWVGEIMVKDTAKVNRKRKSDYFQQIFRSNDTPINDGLASTQDGNLYISHVNGNGSNSSASPSGFPKTQSAVFPPANASLTAAPGQHPSLGAEALVEEGNHEDEIPFSIQEDDSKGRECISLGNIPPTSVATVVYNNYKLLLLSLGQTLDSGNVVQLMQWAQNFLIENAQDATDVFFQLDRKRVINASDLSQLCDFFSSIPRMDLVYVIDRFLLGDYSLLHQIPSITPTTMVVVDGPVTNQRRTAATDGTASPSVTNTARNTGCSNGSKLSKFQRPHTRCNDTTTDTMSPSVFLDLDQSQGDDDCLCGHYKRHCYVKFECCDNFWPCYRCHNDQSTCGRKLTSSDTKMVKCMYCDKVQQFGQFCCYCGATFAEYFCDLCKHLTGKDDHPYHCEKCGICRVHGDSSFHCDVCGLCLDVQLRGNHKCREGSAHEECCICLEDAFTGCQILPCSHKVHKECATQMIRSAGMVRCPICRESFALKPEERQLSRKRTGK